MISITEVKLRKEYRFMYANFIVSSQQTLYLLLEKNDEIIDALAFDFLIYKYGYPNDEVSHPLSEYGLGFYVLFLVNNSPWITELKVNNREHSSHTDSLFDNDMHYIARFKDVTVEIICTKFTETQLTKTELVAFVEEEIGFLNP